jgi:hypothetical protein
LRRRGEWRIVRQKDDSCGGIVAENNKNCGQRWVEEEEDKEEEEVEDEKNDDDDVCGQICETISRICGSNPCSNNLVSRRENVDIYIKYT